MRTAGRWWLVGMLLLATPALAETWPPDSVRYVRADADGNNNGRTNTAAGAWTLQEACDSVTAGYTVLIGAGSYTSTTLSPDNAGVNRDLNPPWPGSHGRIRFVGNTSNAQACSVSAIVVNKPYITVMGVSTKVDGSVLVGSTSGRGTSDATFDSLYKVYQKRSQNAFNMRGMQYSTVAACSVFNRPGTGLGRAFLLSHEMEPDIACQLRYDKQGARISQFDTLSANYVHVEENRPGERRITFSDDSDYNLISRNHFVGKWTGALVGGNVEYLYFMWVVNASYNRFEYNRYIFDVSSNPPDPKSLWFALRDSSESNVFYGDTAYCGIDYNNLGGGFVNNYQLGWGLGQNANPCAGDCGLEADGVTKRICTLDSKPHNNIIRRGKYVFKTRGLFANNVSLGLTVDSCVVACFNGTALDLEDTEITGSKFWNNTLVSFGGNRTISRIGSKGIHYGGLHRNIIVCDSLPSPGAGSTCTTGGPGGAIYVHDGLANGALNWNLYWSRTGRTTPPVYRGVRDSVIKWSYRGFFPPDTTRSNSCNQPRYRQYNDFFSKYGDPVFTDSSATKAFNAKPKASGLVRSITSGYVGAVAPADTVAPSVPIDFSVSSTAAFVKTILWTSVGDDSLFFNAESVFVCERASVDSSRIDNTNYKSFVMMGFRAPAPSIAQTFVCNQTGTITLNGASYSVPTTETTWSGCGSDALLPGNKIGWVRIVTKDDEGNLSFSKTLQLGL